MKKEWYLIVLLLLLSVFIACSVADDGTEPLAGVNPYPTPKPPVNGSAWVASFPTGAAVYLDGVQKGMTDVLITNVVPGNHTLILTKTGYQNKTVPVEVKAGETTVLAPICLTKGEGPEGNTGSVYVASSPSNATIFIDGVQKGLTDRLVTNIPAGTHNLKLMKAGYQSKTVQIEVKAGETMVLAPICLTPGEEPAGSGSVYVASTPTNATIWLDGVQKGLTDKLVTNVPAGLHNLTLNKTGYQNKTIPVEVKADQTTVLDPICLTPGEGPEGTTGSVFVSSNPTNATIYLDGVQKGLTDRLVSNVSAGTHNLTLVKAGYQNATIQIEVVAGRTETLPPVYLTPAEQPADKGSVYVASIPTNATIRLDGVQKGLTDKLLTNITPGNHTLVLTRTGFQSRTIPIEVKAGETVTLPPIILTPAEQPDNKGSVYVSSIPTNATIYLDGAQKGLTDKLLANISAGTHTLMLKKTGYQNKTVQIEVVAGETKVLAPVTLVPAGDSVGSGSVYVASVPSNATIFIDGMQRGFSDMLVINVSAGTHSLTLNKTGYQNATVTIEVNAGETKVLAPISLTPLDKPENKGSVYVSSIPSNATITLDGVQKGLTDRLLTNITPGTHTLKLTKAGYQSTTVQIEVAAGERKVLAPITLTPGNVSVTTGSVYVASVPSNATIYLDGAQKGTTNKLVANIPAGTHNLTLTRAGYQPTSIWVDIVAGVTKILASIPLSPI